MISIALFLLIAAPASAADKYSFANGCFANADSGPLRFQAATLGEYLLIAADGTYRTAAGTVAEPGQDAVWTAQDDLSLTNGEATLSGFAEATGCAEIPDVQLNATGTPFKGKRAFSAVKGFHDQHAHLMAFDFLGGNFHCGRPWSPFGVKAALPDCASIQGPQGSAAPIQNFLDYGQPAAPHDTVGWPTFAEWPTHEKLSYEQTYWKWIERAWMGGLRLIQTNHVDNEVLCQLVPGHTTSCNDMDAVRRQAQYLIQLQDYIDAQYGGPGKGFFRIVSTPFQARRVINRGKLAVVQGIELSRIFGCGIRSEVPECTTADVDAGIDEVEKLGVRVFYPIHKFDNAFGGTKMDGGPVGVLINFANRKQTGAFWNVKTCDGPDSDREQSTTGGGVVELLSGTDPALLGGSALPVYPAAPHCNARGLSELGDYVLRRMIDRDFIIEIDHMSAVASRQALNVIVAKRYPGVISSHTWASDSDLPRVRAVGGAVAPSTGGTAGFAKKWAADRAANRSPKYPYTIGFGADTNGLASQGGPRSDNAENPVVYPFELGGVRFDKQVSGEQDYDINVDGVAHYGLYPDWVADLRNVAGDQIVKDLFNGAEGYLGMWERAEGIRGPSCPAGRVTRRGVGRVRLGIGWKRTLYRAGQPWTRPGASFRWCRPSPAKVRTAALFARGKVALAGRRGVRSFGRLKVRPAGGGRVFIRRGKSSAVALRSLAGSRKRARRALRAAGL